MTVEYASRLGTTTPDMASVDAWTPPFVVFGRSAATQVADLLSGYTAWISLPPAPTAAVSRLPQLLREVRSMTGWSQRDLADVLETSHTTVRRLETDGRVTARSRGTAVRVGPMHAVLFRLARVAQTPDALGTALATRVGDPPHTPADFLRSQLWNRAFTAALDAISGPRPTMLAPPTGSPPPLDSTREILR